MTKHKEKIAPEDVGNLPDEFKDAPLGEGSPKWDNDAPPAEEPSPLYPASFAERAKAVAAMGGKLEEHQCCPKCGDQSPRKAPVVAQAASSAIRLPEGGEPPEEPSEEDRDASCDHCGWSGKVADLIDTVQSGATKLPKV